MSMTSQRLVFVLPPESHLISGGNIYNRELIAAVRRRRPVDTVSAAQCKEEIVAGSAGIYFVDTLILQEFFPLLSSLRRPEQRAVLVVHYLPSLEPSLVEEASLVLEAAALPRFDGFLATSDYMARLLRERGFAQASYLVVPPGLPDRPRPPIEYRPGVRVLTVGNLIPVKGIKPFLTALAAVTGPGDPFTIDHVGRSDLDRDYAAACLAAAKSPALVPRVRFHPPVPHEAMDRYYREASVFVSPSQMETFGMALQEARAFGLPILACATGNTASHVEHGRSGYLYDSIADLASGLIGLVRDPERMRSLFATAQALRTGGEYTWDVAAGEFLRQVDACLR